MKICQHYEFDKDACMYYSLVKIHRRKHVFYCRQCGMKLHDVDVSNLNRLISDKNLDISSRNPNLPKLTDIYEMLAPVPGQYK